MLHFVALKSQMGQSQKACRLRACSLRSSTSGVDLRAHEKSLKALQGKNEKCMEKMKRNGSTTRKKFSLHRCSDSHGEKEVACFQFSVHVLSASAFSLSLTQAFSTEPNRLVSTRYGGNFTFIHVPLSLE